MSLFTSLYTGASGLQANTLDMSVIGDNIANANTIGFKSGRAAFESALAANMVGGSQVGLGVRLQAVQRVLLQGAMLNTGMSTDMAIDGSGYFMVAGQAGDAAGTYYTRAGQFTLSKDGDLVTLDGLKVQGYLTDAMGRLTRQVGDLHLGSISSAPQATTEITIAANLQADAEILPPWDPTDPHGTANFTTSTTVYDSLGVAHQAEVFFRKSADGEWEWHAMTDGNGIQGGTPGVLEEIASGTLYFDTDGKLISESQGSSFVPVGATVPQDITFDFGTTDEPGITQFAGTSAVSFLGQDGYPAGELAAVTVEADGTIMGTFSNGELRALGQVAVAEFEAPDQLRRVGGNLLARTGEAGEPSVGVAGSGGRGSIVAGALEQSNVDLANEFIRMIAAQRGFQANAKVITASDQLLTELMTIKR